MRPNASVLACAWILLAGAMLPATALAALRSPQVPVLGNTLQACLNAQGETIDVLTQQNSIQRWASTNSPNTSFSIQLESVVKSPGSTFGVYNAGDAAPALYELFPPEAGSAWFVVGTFRFAPTRLVVNVFDDLAQLRGTTTYLNANKADFGFYLATPGGVFYSQDVRNPGGSAQLLVFAGTGINSGAWWLAIEDTPRAGGESDQGFDDEVIFLDAPICACPVAKCSWGAVKSRFR